MHRAKPPILIAGFALVALLAVVTLAFAMSRSDSGTVLATGEATPTLEAKPSPAATTEGNQGALSGLYELKVYAPYSAAKAEDAAPFTPDDNTCGDNIDNGGDGQKDTADQDCGGSGAAEAYNCIAKMDVDVSNQLKIAVQCYANADIGDPNDALGDPIGEGPDVDQTPGTDPAPDIIAGFPPPPSYVELAPAKLQGTYNPSTDKITFDGCFWAVGGLLGPNIGISANIQPAFGALPNLLANIGLYAGQGPTQCNSKSWKGTSSPLIATLNKVADQSRDLDNDGCTDLQELDKGHTKCGDDPFNPNDYTGALCPTKNAGKCDTLSGNWDLIITAVEPDVCWNGVPAGCADPGDNGVKIPGVYIDCAMDIQQTTGNNLSIRTLCYTDNPSITVNSSREGTSVCGTGTGEAEARECGDGQKGPGPPSNIAGLTEVRPFGPYVSVPDASAGEKHVTLTGSIDKDKNMLIFSGCQPGGGAFGNVWYDAWTNVHTGRGEVDIYYGITDLADCQDGLPVSSGSVYSNALVEMVKQAGKAADPVDDRDRDRDGCSDKQELGNNELFGGMRDPMNRWDFFDVVDSSGNPPGDGKVDLVNDIFALAARFDASDAGGTATVNRRTDPRTTPIPAAPAYHPSFDRQQNFPGDTPGENPWNIEGPDGAIDLVNDIFSMAAQFDHGCQAGNTGWPNP